MPFNKNNQRLCYTYSHCQFIIYAFYLLTQAEEHWDRRADVGAAVDSHWVISDIVKEGKHFCSIFI